MGSYRSEDVNFITEKCNWYYHWQSIKIIVTLRNIFDEIWNKMGSTGFDSKSNWKVSTSRTGTILVNKRSQTFYTAKETTLLLHNLNHSKISLVLPGRKAGFTSKALVYGGRYRWIVNLNLDFRKLRVDFETKEAKQRAVVPDLTPSRKSIQEINV